MNKKNLLLLATIITVGITQHPSLIAGYESTKQEEVKERAGEENEADITTLKEEAARAKPVDDAYATENQENAENMSAVNDAYTTSAAEMGEQMGDNANQL